MRDDLTGLVALDLMETCGGRVEMGLSDKTRKVVFFDRGSLLCVIKEIDGRVNASLLSSKGEELQGFSVEATEDKLVEILGYIKTSIVGKYMRVKSSLSICAMSEAVLEMAKKKPMRVTIDVLSVGWGYSVMFQENGMEYFAHINYNDIGLTYTVYATDYTVVAQYSKVTGKEPTKATCLKQLNLILGLGNKLVIV